MVINMSSSMVYDIVDKSLSNGEPLSVLRMGDGEMVIYHYETADNAKLNRFIRDMRIKNDPNVLSLLKGSLELAIINADIIGLPTERHLQHAKDWDLIPQTYSEIFNKEGIIENSKKYCSINLHIELLNNGLIYSILKRVDEVVVISSRDLESRLKDRFPNLKNIEYFKIPGEYAYEEDKTEDIMFPDRVLTIIDELTAVSRKGQLLIYGGGVTGKLFGSAFKQAGGVALDIGSVFDQWAGKVTRGKGKGSHSYSSENKL